MSATIDDASVHGLWVHSHEEDTDSEMVFRPAGFAFPPSRGRSSLDLKPDGSAVEQEIGPDDRRTSGASSWKLQGRELVLSGGASGAVPNRSLQVVSAGGGRLVLKK